MRPTWGPSGVNRTQVGPMLATWTLLSGYTICTLTWHYTCKDIGHDWIYTITFCPFLYWEIINIQIICCISFHLYALSSTRIYTVCYCQGWTLRCLVMCLNWAGIGLVLLTSGYCQPSSDTSDMDTGLLQLNFHVSYIDSWGENYGFSIANMLESLKSCIRLLI